MKNEMMCFTRAGGMEDHHVKQSRLLSYAESRYIYIYIYLYIPIYICVYIYTCMCNIVIIILRWKRDYEKKGRGLKVQWEEQEE